MGSLEEQTQRVFFLKMHRRIPEVIPEDISGWVSAVFFGRISSRYTDKIHVIISIRINGDFPSGFSNEIPEKLLKKSLKKYAK